MVFSVQHALFPFQKNESKTRDSRFMVEKEGGKVLNDGKKVCRNVEGDRVRKLVMTLPPSSPSPLLVSAVDADVN